MTERVEDFDAEAAETFDSPHALYKELRQHCPVAYSKGLGGFWALTRYEDIERTLIDWQTFTTTIQNVVPRVATTQRRPPLHLDPPHHTPYRHAIAPFLTPQRVEAWRPLIRTMVDALLDPILERGEADMCADFSFKLPIAILAEFFRVSGPDAERIRIAGADFNRAIQAQNDPEVRRTSNILYEIARDLIADRKRTPQDPNLDPTAALLAARRDGEPLPEDMILGALRQFLVVGIVAPTTFIGSMVVHLARHPEHHQLLKKDNRLIGQAVEELLRLYTPYRGFARTTRRDVEICGRVIPKGDVVALLFVSGNRDERVFEAPDEFKLDRPRKDLLTFGRGPHQCPGSALARLQLSLALEAIVNWTERLTLKGPVQMTKWPEYGPLTAPVSIT